MPKKKILLFIVEGQTDETALATALSRIFSTSSVKFQIVHGDILTKDFTGTDKIINAVIGEIKKFCAGVYKKSDFLSIVHLVDMDGAFIPGDAVIVDPEAPVEGREYPFYTDTQIFTPSPPTIQSRNSRKAQNLSKLYGKEQIWGIPYQVYFFSCNLDHTLYGQNNLTEEKKIHLAEEFDKEYGEEIEKFIRFIKNESFSVPGTYKETWDFIKIDCHSLQRYSNFGLALPDRASET